METGGLLERDAVLASLDGMLSEVAAGRSGALYVVGEAGLGKTSLISYTSRPGQSGPLLVGVGRGHPMETSLPFGLMAQALDSIGGHGLLGEDEPGQAVGQGDRAARFYAVLRWLQQRAGSGIVLALDDLHWADADSLALLSFIGRRPGSQACLPPGCAAPRPRRCWGPASSRK